MLEIYSPRSFRGIFLSGTTLSGGAVAILGLTLAATPAQANCVTLGNTTTCNTNSPNPYLSTVGQGNSSAADGRTVTVLPGAGINSGNASAISLRDNATITVDGLVENRSTNSQGGYNTGGNTIEFRDNGTITIGPDGKVLSTGTQVSAEAINVQGTNNTIINNGRINAVKGAAIWVEKPGTLTVVNNGVISTGPLDNSSRTATVIGGNINSGIDFTNRGTVYGSLNLGTGSDTLRLYTGSVITGNFSGGTGPGTDRIYLNGTGSDLLPGQMTGFEYLYKQDSGTWELSGSITNLIAAEVQAGTLILSGNNSGFSGTTTVDSGATLQGRAQSLPTAITNSGLVRFDQPDTGTYSGVISGSGGLEKTGVGVVTLTSALAYSGPTNVSEGTLILQGNNSGYAGATTVSSGATLQGRAQSLPNDITNSGLVRFDQPDVGTYSGVISGTGAVEKVGVGVVTLTSALAYSGPTNVSEGTLILQGNNSGYTGATTVNSGATLQGNALSVPNDIANSGLVRFDQPDIGTYSGVISGSGGVEKDGVGVLTLTSALAYSGPTTVSNGTLILQGDNSGYTGATTVSSGATLQGTASSLPNDIANSGLVRFDQPDIGTYSGEISGSGGVEKTGVGVVTMTSDLSYRGPTTVSEGTLILTGKNSGLTGITTVQTGATLQGRAQSLSAAIINNGLVRFDQAKAGTYSGEITGSGDVEKTGVGVVTLTSALAYSGSTTVSEGKLILRGDNSGYAGATTVSSGATLQGNALSVPNDIANSGLVRFKQSNDGTYSGLISGVGGLDKAGRGTLTLATSQTYTGPTTVSSGTLLLLGNLVSPTSVASAGTLRGIGTIIGTVTNEGTIAPGTPGDIGTLTIQGNYIGNGGIFQTRVGGTPQAPVADVLQISGAGNTASGNTGVTVIDAGGLGDPTTGDGILVVQTLNGATTGNTAFALADRVASGAYEYHLARGASAGNEQNWYLSTYVDPPVPPGPEPGPTPPPDPDFRVETSTYPALPALQRLYTYSFVDTLEQRRGALGTLSALGSEDQSAIWGRAGGSFGDTYGSGASGIDMSYDFGFLQAGIDAVTTSDGHGGRVDAGVFLGIGTSTTDTSTQAEGNTGNASFNAYSVGLYGTWLAASGLYADTLLQATRFSDVSAQSSDDASISTDGWSESVSLEAGYRVGLADSLTLTPQAQIIAENFSLDGTSDDFGSVTFDNGFAARGRLGLELASSFEGIGARTDLTLRANVWHVFSDNPQTTFSSLDGTDKVDFGADFGTTWLAFDAGLTTAVTENASLFANAGYEYGFGDWQAGTGRVGLTVIW